MTVSSQTPINRSTGNGVTTVFPYGFKIISEADIEVTVDGVVKTLNVDYTVSGVGNEAGGNVTMTAAPANLASVVRRRNMALVRTTDYQDQGEMPAETLDNDFDSAVLMIQQVDEQIGRAVTVPAGVTGFDGQLPDPVASMFLRINSAGDGFDLVSEMTPGVLTVTPFIETLLNDTDATAARATLGAQVAGSYQAAGSYQPAGDGSNIHSLPDLTSVPNGTVTNLPAVAGAFKNLAASANGTSANISVSADEVVLSNASNQYVTLRSVSLTIAGTSVGANALDAGTIATGTWYSVWVIWNGTTTAGLLSTSATSPTLPGGYTHKARVGWIRTDASGNKYPLAFKQKGRNVRHIVAAATNVTALPVIATGTATWPTAAGINNFFPSTTAKATFQFVGANLASGYVYLSPNANYALCCMSNSYTSGSPMYQVVDMVLESSNVYYGGNNAMGISSYGWEDNL